MKPQRTLFKGIAMAITLGVLLVFAFIPPPASTQEKDPLTPTPSDLFQTPEPLQAPGIRQ